MFVVACVTAAMITILSAFNGIESLVADLFTTFDPEITISPSEGKVFPVTDSLTTVISSFPEVSAISASIEDDVIVRYDGQPTVATLKGIDSLFYKVTDVKSVMRQGAFALKRDEIPCAIPGLGVQNELGIPIHPTDFSLITISAPIRGKKLSRFKDKALNTLPILVSGVFSVNAEMDVKYILAPLDYARELFNYENEVSHLNLGLVPDTDPEDLKELLREKLGPDFVVETRYDKNALVHKTNRAEKWATFLILTFIMVIAGFNIMASLTMLILEKRKDIFILQSVGFTSANVRRIFVNQGMLINLAGALLGLTFGLLICWAQQTFGLKKLEGSIVPFYPIEVRFLDVLGTMATVMVIGTLFSTLMVRYLIRRFTH